MGNQYAKEWKKLRMPPIGNQEHLNHHPVSVHHDIFIVFRPDKKYIWLYAYIISKNQWHEVLKLDQSQEIDGLTLTFNPVLNILYVFKKQEKSHKMMLFNMKINNDFYGDNSDTIKLMQIQLIKEIDIGSEGGYGAMNSILINNKIHVIDRLKHWIYDIDSNTTEDIGKFSKSTPAPARLIYDTYSQRKRLLKFSSRIGAFDDDTREWRQLKYRIPDIPGVRYYGCVLCRNGRYVLLLGGQHWHIIGNTWRDSGDIFVFDINEEAFHKTLGCPVTGDRVYAMYGNAKVELLILGMANETEYWLDSLTDDILHLIWRMCGNKDYEFVHIFANTENKTMEHWRIELNKLLNVGKGDSVQFSVAQ
eukprot:250280_1